MTHDWFLFLGFLHHLIASMPLAEGWKGWLWLTLIIFCLIWNMDVGHGSLVPSAVPCLKTYLLIGTFVGAWGFQLVVRSGTAFCDAVETGWEVVSFDFRQCSLGIFLSPGEACFVTLYVSIHDWKVVYSYTKNWKFYQVTLKIGNLENLYYLHFCVWK